VKRTTTNYIIDVGMAVFFTLAALTGVLKLQAIPRFLVRYDVYLPTYLITQIHKWAGLLLAGSVLLHLILHWKWLVATTRTVFRGKRREPSRYDEENMKGESSYAR
jgi:hypothetical protein